MGSLKSKIRRPGKLYQEGRGRKQRQTDTQAADVVTVWGGGLVGGVAQGAPSTAVLTCSTAPLLQSRASPERNANLRRGFMTYTNGG